MSRTRISKKAGEDWEDAYDRDSTCEAVLGNRTGERCIFIPVWRHAIGGPGFKLV